MKRIVLGIAFLTAALVTAASATPVINGAAMFPRVFNDCPTSTLTSVNNYPAQIVFDDAVLDCGGFANRHAWRLSDDGGTNAALFMNGDSFRLGATLLITGTSEGEAGLQVSPWWSQLVDGVFNVRTTDGEIACFGGRLPFYSFTAAQGLAYAKGNTIYLEVEYLPNGLSMASPATIEYKITYLGTDYTSGPLPFDEGNPAEPYGTWGMLDEAQVGGHIQCFLQGGNPNAQLRAEWTDVVYEILGPISVEQTSWGAVKGLYR